MGSLVVSIANKVARPLLVFAGQVVIRATLAMFTVYFTGAIANYFDMRRIEKEKAILEVNSKDA